MNFIVLCLCVSLSGVLSEYLNLNEGDECEWEGLRGACVEETRCLTTIDDDSPRHPVCYNKSGRKVICCTDCKLVNSTKNAIFIPPSGLFFKNGQKARDKCLEYIHELPYECNKGGYYAGIWRDLDEANKCYSYTEWESESSFEDGKPKSEHPYLALFGYGKELASAIWFIRGVIISNKYILTSAYNFREKNNDTVSFVAVGGVKSYDITNTWQTHSVKRLLSHPNFTRPYIYNDIGLIEFENTITFNNNVLPACLYVEAAADETAIVPIWIDPKSETYMLVNTIQTINIDKFSDKECWQAYVTESAFLNNGEIYDTQMCYGIRSDPTYNCKFSTGKPLLINTQFSRCVYTVIGVNSLGFPCSFEDDGSPNIFTRVAPYIPWIESVVWDGE